MKKAVVISVMLSFAVLISSCSKKDNDDNPPVDPLTNLINHDGGIGGGPQTGEITVAVFDDITKQPIVSAWVLVDHGAVVQGQTDSSGRASFSGLTTGMLDITIAASGYANLSLIGISSRYIAMPMERRRRLSVQGIINASAPSGTTCSVDFLAQNKDLMGGSEPKYGSVVQSPTGFPPAYEVLFDAGATDSLVFTETDGNGKIVNRKLLPIGPFTSDQTGVNVTFDATTGLCNMAGTITGLSSGLIFGVDVRAWIGDDSYDAYSVTGSGTTRTYLLQVPPSASMSLVVQSYTSILGMGFPQEAQEFAASSGSPDNASPVQADLQLDMAQISGSFLNYGGSTGAAVVLKYGRCQTLVPNFPASGYTLRVPKNLTAQAAVGAFTGTYPAIVLDWFIETTYGPYSADSVRNFDFNGFPASQLALTSANLPSGISSHDPSAAILTAYPDRTVAVPTYMLSGTAGASNIAFTTFGYGRRQGHTYVLMATDTDSVTDAETIYIKGGITDPAADLATPMQIPLLDVPVPSSPLDASTQPLPQVAFSWAATNVTSEGLIQFDITDSSTGEKVWIVRLQHQATSFALPALPSAVSALELLSGETYEWTIAAMTLSGFNIDDFTIDQFPQDGLSNIAFMSKTMRMSNSQERTFSVQ